MGLYYRYYEHYYDYIKNDDDLVVEKYQYFQEDPFKYATNFGVFITAELLMGYIGFEWEFGYNIYKPFYEIDFQLNQGFYWNIYPPNGETETLLILAELEDDYAIKQALSARVGLKYYLFTNEKSPVNNLYLGVHINANAGQADFTELTLGYVYRFKLKEKK